MDRLAYIRRHRHPWRQATAGRHHRQHHTTVAPTPAASRSRRPAWARAIGRAGARASGSLNEIGINRALGRRRDRQLLAAGKVTLAASTTGDVDALAIAGSATGALSSSGKTGALAGAGAGSANTVETDIHAVIRNGSTVVQTSRARPAT
jgi:hypothetical protein